MKHTKGECEITNYETPNEYNQPDLDNFQISSGITDICVLWPISNPDLDRFDKALKYDEEETEANAELIKEAFNVTNETGYSPKQLVDELEKLKVEYVHLSGIKAELLEALILANKIIDRHANYIIRSEEIIINKAIKNNATI